MGRDIMRVTLSTCAQHNHAGPPSRAAPREPWGTCAARRQAWRGASESCRRPCTRCAWRAARAPRPGPARWRITWRLPALRGRELRQMALAAERGAGLPGQLEMAGSRSLADHLAVASAVPRPSYQLVPVRQPPSMLASLPDEAKLGIRSLAACLGDTITAPADGGPARTPARQGMAKRRAAPVSRADGARAAAYRHAQAAAHSFTGGFGINDCAESTRHALPPVRWLLPPEPVSLNAPAACLERLRASAALEAMPAFVPVSVGGAAAQEGRAGPAGTRLSGAKRRAGAEANAAFVAFLQRSQQHAAAAEQVRR